MRFPGEIQKSSTQRKWKKVKSLSRVWRFWDPPWTVAHQAPLSTGFSRQEYWNGVPFPSPGEYLICSYFATLLQVTSLKPKRVSLEDLFFQDSLSLSCSHNETSRLWQKIYVFRWNVSIKCMAFFAADVFGCQSLNYDKLEQSFQNPKCKNWNLWCPRNVSCLGLCLYL